MKMWVRLPKGNLVKQYFYYYTRYFLLFSCLILSHTDLISVHLDLLFTCFELLSCFKLLLLAFNSFHFAAADKRGNASENTAGSCQWFLTVTLPISVQFKPFLLLLLPR